MARPCGWCTHPRREELERRVLAGESIHSISLDLPFEATAGHRHVRNHLGIQALRVTRRAAGLHLSDFTDRLAALADETADVRAHAKQTGDGKLLLSAIAAERDTLSVLLSRLGIDGEETVDVLREARALVQAVTTVLSARAPEIALAISGCLSEMGEDDLADSLRALAERSQAALTAPPPHPSSSTRPTQEIT